MMKGLIQISNCGGSWFAVRAGPRRATRIAWPGAACIDGDWYRTGSGADGVKEACARDFKMADRGAASTRSVLKIR